MKEIYIVAAARTAIGSFGGALKNVQSTKLGAIVIKEVVARSGINANEIQEVYMGSVLQANLGQAPARQAAIFAGLSNTARCTTINKVCASGMKAISIATQSILCGDADVVVAGGMENMSQVPFYSTNTRWGNKYGDVIMVDGIAKDGLTDVYHNYPMGNASDLCAKYHAISREDQDAYAMESYKRSKSAWENGRFEDEIVQVEIPQHKGAPLIFKEDEEFKNVHFDKIAGLKPAFSLNGTATAANSSTMNDGAAALLLMSKQKATQRKITPIAKIRGYADSEQAPEWFTTSPALAITRALSKAGLTLADIDYFELNEAFSTVGLVNMKMLKLDPKKVNVNGGAVSLGHPLGCSGARIVVTLINVLKQNNGKYGVASICNGGGGASAIVIELVNQQ